MARPANGPSGEERRRQIIGAAARVFAQKGYTEATTKDIARAAGITHAAIYHYFRDKRTLFAAVLTTYSPLAGVADILRTAGGDEEPRAVLTRLTLAMIERLETSDELPVFQLLMSEVLRDPDATAVARAARRQLMDAVADYLRGQQTRGRLRQFDPELAAQFVVGSLCQCVLGRTVSGDPALLRYRPEQIATAFVAMVLGGLQAPAGAVMTPA
jgi:TetR/AcrR family transcriptional repressor of mexJK operon